MAEEKMETLDKGLDNMVRNFYGADQGSVNSTVSDDREEQKVSKFGVVCSFLCPFVGLVLFYMRRNNRVNPEVYLYATILGYTLESLIGAIKMMIET